MKILTGTQMAEIDRKAINESKIDGLILMENAGIKAYQKIKELISDFSETQKIPFRNVVIVAGKGNNAGDGFVIARHLIQDNIPTTVFAITDRSSYSGDALKNYMALENFGDINLITEDTFEDLRDSILEASIVVDALLGTGLKGPVEGNYADTIDIINESDGIIVAVDMPSGVMADTGQVHTVAVEADCTVTFAAPKLGLMLYPGADYAGDLVVANIGIPDFLMETSESTVYLTTEQQVFDFLPWRPDDSNKGIYGKVLTIAGSRSMTGAALLSSMSTLKVGAGISTLASPKSLMPYYVGVYPELTYLPVEETFESTFCASSLTELESKIDQYQAIILGPGLSVTSDTKIFTKEVIQLILEKNLPVVIDADALNCMAEMDAIKLNDNVVITPHPKELSRLLAVELQQILDDKMKYLKLAQEKYDCNVVLKGARTLIASEATININMTGNSALATGGTGDVLSGVIAGLMAQGLTAYNAAVTGVYLHGLAGDLASEDLTEYSVVASDVMNYLSKAIYKLSIL